MSQPRAREQRGYESQSTFGGGQKSGFKGSKPGRTRLDKITGDICRNFNLGVCKNPTYRWKHICNKVIKKPLQNGKVVDWVCREAHEATACTN